MSTIVLNDYAQLWPGPIKCCIQSGSQRLLHLHYCSNRVLDPSSSSLPPLLSDLFFPLPHAFRLFLFSVFLSLIIWNTTAIILPFFFLLSFLFFFFSLFFGGALKWLLCPSFFGDSCSVPWCRRTLWFSRLYHAWVYLWLTRNWICGWQSQIWAHPSFCISENLQESWVASHSGGVALKATWT